MTPPVPASDGDRPPVAVVAFDLMDTLVRDPFREALHAATGVQPRELFARRDPEVYPALERGEIDEVAYWASYDEAGIAVDPERFHEVRLAGTSWLPGMRSLVDEVRRHCRVVVASNYPHWLADHEDELLAGACDEVVGSYQLGARKPDLAFFEALLGRLDVDDPARVVFVDDRPTNLEGAEAAGMVAVEAGPADRLRADLVAAGVPLP